MLFLNDTAWILTGIPVTDADGEWSLSSCCSKSSIAYNCFFFSRTLCWRKGRAPPAVHHVITWFRHMTDPLQDWPPRTDPPHTSSTGWGSGTCLHKAVPTSSRSAWKTGQKGRKPPSTVCFWDVRPPIHLTTNLDPRFVIKRPILRRRKPETKTTPQRIETVLITKHFERIRQVAISNTEAAWEAQEGVALTKNYRSLAAYIT